MSRHAISGRRMVAVPVGAELLVQMVRLDYTAPPMRCIQGVPADAKFEGLYVEPKDGAVLLLFTHATFAPVFPGESVPRLVSAHRRTDVQVVYD